MKAIRLETDEAIKQHFFNLEKRLFFKERTESVYESLGEHTLEEAIDATSHGFEIVAVNREDASQNEIPEEDLEFVEVES